MISAALPSNHSYTVLSPRESSGYEILMHDFQGHRIFRTGYGIDKSYPCGEEIKLASEYKIEILHRIVLIEIASR